jgi:thioredoxin reductase
MTTTVDVCVVGGGPAGLAAATWLGRYRRSVVVLDSSEQRNRWVESSHGYLGSDPTNPAELLQRARSDLAQYATVQLEQTTATSAQCSVDGVFSVLLEGGGEIHARRLVLAMGVRDEFPDLPRFFDFYGRSIFHCPSCDGFETRGKPVVVFGWDEHVAGFARGLLDWAASVRVVTDGRPFDGDDVHRRQLAQLGIDVVEDEVVQLCGDDGDLVEVRLRHGGVVPCERAFFSIAHHPRTWLAEQLGCELTEHGCLSVDEEGRTSVAGVYGAGDITPGMQYIATAVAEGTKAGTACALSLRDEQLGGATGEHDRPEDHAVLGGELVADDSALGIDNPA